MRIFNYQWTELYLMIFLFMSFSVKAVTFDVENVQGLTDGIIGANGNTDGETFIMNLTQDIVIDRTVQGQGYDGNVLPFLSPRFSNANVVIDGQGHTISRSLDTANEFRFIAVVGASNTNFRTTLVIKNLTLSNFQLTGFLGGTLFVGNRGSIRLENVTIENSTSLQRSGGAIYSEGGGVTVDRSTFRNNFASEMGGAIAMNGSLLTIVNSIFSNNNSFLGAISLNEATATITNSIISDNVTSGIFANESRLDVFQSTISGNAGAGIAMQGEIPTPAPNAAVGRITTNTQLDLRLIRSTISGNSTPLSAGIDLKGQSAVIAASTITDNNSRSGIFIRESDSANTGFVALMASLVSGNTGVSGVNGRPNEIQCSNTPGGAPPFNIYSELARSLIGDDRDPTFGSGGGSVTSSCTFAAPGFNAGLVFASSDGDIPTRLTRILRPLADNGCTVKAGAIGTRQCVHTHALSENSPALELAFGSIGEDQRGFPRIGQRDAGAFEGFIADQVNCYAIKAKNNNIISFCL